MTDTPEALARELESKISAWFRMTGRDADGDLAYFTANNADAILTALRQTARPSPQGREGVDDGEGVADDLEAQLERFGLVLTDDPDFDHNEGTFERAKAGFVRGIRASQAVKITQAEFDQAASEVEHLQHVLDITNADHIALWLEENLDAPLGFLACRIIEAHEVALRTANTGRAEVLALVQNLFVTADDDRDTGWNEACQCIYDTIRALSSPPVTAAPTPEVATAVEVEREALLQQAAQRATARLERTDWRPTRAHYESLRNEINAAIRARTPPPPPESYEQHGNDWDMAGQGVRPEGEEG